MAIKPYVMKHPGMVAAALVALVISAGVMLVVPMAVRRMIDYGFGSDHGLLINQYFGMLIVIGAVLALASAARFTSSTGWASGSSRICATTCSAT